MAELPTVPDLDFGSPPKTDDAAIEGLEDHIVSGSAAKAEAASNPSPITMAPATTPLPVPSPVPPSSSAPASPSPSTLASIPAAFPSSDAKPIDELDPALGALAVASDAIANEVLDPVFPDFSDSEAGEHPEGNITESVDEVLHHASEQTIKISHMEDELNGLRQSIDYLREELLSRGMGTSNNVQDVKLGFAELEGGVTQVQQSQGRLLLFVAVQTLLLIVLLGMSIFGGSVTHRADAVLPSAQVVPGVVAAPPSTMPIPDPTLTAEPAEDPSPTPKRRSRKRRRRR